MTSMQSKLAQDAVIEAIEELAASREERPYSHNVPIEATRIMVSKSRGKITDEIASDEIEHAIVTLKAEGKIDAPTEAYRNWRILH